MDTTDRRPIDEMQFGYEHGRDMPESHAAQRDAARAAITATVRETLTACGCLIADDINRLGCTGVAKVFPDRAVETVQTLRLDMAGGGVGLPCFVPPTLFCLAHNTIGGLEDKQQAHHTDAVELVARELTPEEAAKVAAMNAMRKMSRAGAEEFVAGRSAAEADEIEGVALEEQGLGAVAASRAQFVLAWKCPEHTSTNWACRYCVAQAVVEGSLTPVFAFPVSVAFDTAHGETREMTALTPDDVAPRLAELTAGGIERAELFVRVATFTRKLSRD